MRTMQGVWIGLMVWACDADPTEKRSPGSAGVEVEENAPVEDAPDSAAPSCGDDSASSVSPQDSGDAEAAPAENLLVDAGFEIGDAAWSIWGGAERVNSDARSGSWALELTQTNGAEQRVVGLEPNSVYRLSGWGKNSDEEPLLIGVKDYGGEEVRVSFSDAEYTDGALTFTTGFANTQATIYAYKHAGSGLAWADDLWLQYEAASDRELVWSDEFDGEGALDDEKWSFENGFVRNEELQWYQSENAFQEDGLLIIEGRAEERPNPDYVAGSTDWRTRREMITHTSASVTTKDKFSWQYGHLVVRAKVTNFVGTWPAIWTLGVECEWPSNGEVDVMENYGGNVLANFAWGSNSRWTPHWDSSHWPVADFEPGWTDSFHIWEMEWDADRMVIRLDGAVLNDVALTGTVNGSAACAGENPFQQPHRLLLNLALGGAGGSVEGLAFPTRYTVDYVRVYQ